MQWDKRKYLKIDGKTHARLHYTIYILTHVPLASAKITRIACRMKHRVSLLYLRMIHFDFSYIINPKRKYKISIQHSFILSIVARL